MRLQNSIPRRLRSPGMLRLASVALVLGLAGAAAGSALAKHLGSSAERPIPYRDLTGAIGPLGTFGRPTPHVFRRERNYVRYVSERHGTAVPGGYPQRMVVLFAVGPRSSPAYRLTVAGVVERRGRVAVRLRELTPGPGDEAPSRLTFPYRAISIPWTSRPVTIEWLGRP